MSYNEAISAAYPVYENIENLLYGGTDHELDGNLATDAVSYGLNEDITFSIKLKGD